MIHGLDIKDKYENIDPKYRRIDVLKMSVNDVSRLITESINIDRDHCNEIIRCQKYFVGKHYKKDEKGFITAYVNNDFKNKQDDMHKKTINMIWRSSCDLQNKLASYKMSVTFTPRDGENIEAVMGARICNSILDQVRDSNCMDTEEKKLRHVVVNEGEGCLMWFFDTMKGNFLKTYSHKSSRKKITSKSFDKIVKAENDGTDLETWSSFNFTPDYSGELVYKRIPNTNILRPPDCTNMDRAEWLGFYEIMNMRDLKLLVKDKNVWDYLLSSSRNMNLFTFNSMKNKYTYKQPGLYQDVAFIFFRPGGNLPRGYYFVHCNGIILFQGELPYGVFPIAYEGVYEKNDSPRHFGYPHNLIEPQQALNATKSKISNQKHKLGDTKILHSNNVKVGDLNVQGVTHIPVQDQGDLQNPNGKPFIHEIKAKSGEEYVNIFNSEMESFRFMSKSNLLEDPLNTQKQKKSGDFLQQFFMSVKEKGSFNEYSDTYVSLLKKSAKIVVKLAKNYYDERNLVPLVKGQDAINVKNFKKIMDLDKLVKLDEQDDSIESKMGQHAIFQTLIQYGGKHFQENPEQLGMLIKTAPLGNFEELYSNMTQPLKVAENVVLKVMNGVVPKPMPYQDYKIILAKLGSETLKPYYERLSEKEKAVYQKAIELYTQAEAELAQQIKAMEADEIPLTGMGVKVDLHTKDADTKRSQKVVIPQDAIEWLIQRAQQQQSYKQELVNKGIQPGMAVQLDGEKVHENDLPPDAAVIGGNPNQAKTTRLNVRDDLEATNLNNTVTQPGGNI